MMKISLTFHGSVFLMAVLLTFNMPFITFAQENNDSVLAIADAKRDADADVNKLLWGGVGFVVVPSCITLGFIGGVLAADSSNKSLEDAVPYFLCGSTVGCLLPFISIYSYNSGPPPERLIGKSPEYLKVYTDTYKSKARQLRIVSAGAGGAFGCLLGFALTSTW